MAVLPILRHPDPVLSKKAEPVTEFNEALQVLIDDMFQTMYAAPGIGLAAPQIGRSLRLFVYDVRESDEHPRYKGVMINAEFLTREGRQNAEEGCLSVEDYRTWVTRAGHVVIRGLDRDGKEVTIDGTGLLARMFQHEMDHLEGKLFIDRISSLKRNIYLKRQRKRQRAEQME
jgi:peptide deformylase